ncbi:hypothetical protein HPB49_010273 [Dermacentor silvarum]|uniref:Uncharacterized protein n=1 Tax=Dermacentor silvarum TaxID=543639 RepID=A0ACB8DP30_DERSI|nr:hypothetical protein HPB49_010273 [Dermacentor silvarum]
MALSPAARAKLMVSPTPFHMQPTRHAAHRDHRSRYLRREYPVGCSAVRVLFTDASPADEREGVAVVVDLDLMTVFAASEPLELSYRAAGDRSAIIRPQPFSYASQLAEIRLTRQHYPPPHPSLSRRQAVCWRQLQTNTSPTPPFQFPPLPSRGPAKCPHCGDRPTLLHMVWLCQDIQNVHPVPNPTLTSWEERLTDATVTGQRWLLPMGPRTKDFSQNCIDEPTRMGVSTLRTAVRLASC